MFVHTTHIKKSFASPRFRKFWNFYIGYKWNIDPHKQHAWSFYCSWKPHIAWWTIIQIDFQKLWSRLQYTPVGLPLIPNSTCSCIDACLYPSWHTIHKFIKALLAQIVPLLNGDSVYISQSGWTWRRYRDTGTFDDMPRSGHPRATTAVDDRYLRISARRNPDSNATMLNNAFRVAIERRITTQTVRNRLHDAQLYSRLPWRGPSLQPRHHAARYRWAQQHAEWTPRN
jgi:Transposase.